MKKILIFSVTAGNGHNQCAKSMKAKLESMGEVEVKIVDLLNTYSNVTEAWIADKGYSFVVSKMLPFYQLFYNHYKRQKPENRWKCMAQRTALTTVGGVLKEIIDFQPDLIYCTHFYPAIAITDLRLVYDIPCKCIVANLDYVHSPFWEACIGLDYFNEPNEDFVPEALEKGFRREQLLTFGLPSDERTLAVTNKDEAKEKLGLSKDVFTILVMFGGGYWSGGFKIFKNIVDLLKGKKVQIIMINGKNQKGYDKVAKMKFDENMKVINVGFTSEMPLYMSAADMIVNKLGGSSLTEIINQGLPMLITEKIPAQELYNLEYMKSKGGALSFKTKNQLKAGLEMIMDNPSLREQMSENALKLKRRGISELADFILAQPLPDYNKLLNTQIDFTKVEKMVRKAVKKQHKARKATLKNFETLETKLNKC